MKSLQDLIVADELVAAAERFMGTKVVPVPRSNEQLRVQLPGKEKDFGTFPHCDGVSYPKDDNFLQVWVPLAEIPKSTGGLALMPGTHKVGPMAYYSRNLVKLGTPLNRNQLYEWLES